MDKRISAIAAARYEPAILLPAVRRHFELLRVSEDLRPGMRVVLKPNLLAKRPPEAAVTTHPAVVEAVILALQEHGVEDILIADSPGGPYTKTALQGVYNTSGLAEVAARTGAALNTDTGFQTLTGPQGALCRSFDVITPVAEADFVINLCKLKTHAMVGYSGAVKNLFGCVPGLQKPELHFRFAQKDAFCRMLVDLALLIRPGLTIMDGVVGMEGDGPGSGDPRAIGMTFAARNPFALDRGVCDMIGMGPQEVLTLRSAIDAGLCPGAADEIDWLGDGKPAPLDDFRPPASSSLSFTSYLPRGLRAPAEWVEQRFFSPRPQILWRRCIGCAKCAESCAPEAITMQDHRAVLDHSKCIRCFCCQEMCPVKAVKIRRFRLLRG